MTLGRMPYNAIKPDYQADVVGHTGLTATHSTKVGEPKQVFCFGNRCGHIKNSPRSFRRPEHHKKHSLPIIETAIKNLQSTYKNPYKFAFGQVLFHLDKTNKDGSKRKVRSESREALACIFTQALIYYTSIDTMIAGQFDKKSRNMVKYYESKFFTTVTHMTLNQVRSVIRILKKFNYLTITQRREFNKTKGKWESLNPIIKVSPKLFLDLGITPTDFIGKANQELKEIAKTAKKEEKLLFQQHLQQKLQERKQYERRNKIDKKENPGKERLEHNKSLYRDYTGISNRRDSNLRSSDSSSKGNATIIKSIHEILSGKFKPPPN